MIITKPAVKIQQCNLTIFSTRFLVSDLLEHNFYQIDRLGSAGNETSGYQRLLNPARAKKFAEYLIQAARENEDAFLPTSIFLATDKNISYDEKTNTISFDISEVGPFSVVDGQHRIEGLKIAAQEVPAFRNFQISANIAVNLDKISQMCHFLIVNSTQKSVDKAIEQEIHSELTKMVDLENTPTLPKWIERQVRKGEDRDALVIARYLNNKMDSPWYKKIQMANEQRTNRNTINQGSFVSSIKKFILSANNPLSVELDTERRNIKLKNYWRAISNILNKEKLLENSALYKTIGFDLFNQITPTVFTQLNVNGNFEVNTIKTLLREAFQELDPSYNEVANTNFWKIGSGASGLNQSAIRKYATELNKSINIARSRNIDTVL